MTALTHSETLLKDLGKMPIFRLSLGSKELFHSNFLELLWRLDRSSFIKMIRQLLNDDSFLPLDPKEYVLSREKEHFDICIFHIYKNCIIYDLILENKVKSIPEKGQLSRYRATIDELNTKKKKEEAKSSPRYLLLSLATVFPDSPSVLKPWEIVHYNSLKAAIEKQSWPETKDGFNYKVYIADYCEFIGKLHELAESILVDLDNEFLFQDVNAFVGERMHDLYIKLRCTSFMLRLKTLLENNENNVPVRILAAECIRKEDENGAYINKAGVYLNVNIFNAVGQIGALIWDGKGDIYEVVIQGEQYRHGINPIEKEKGKDKREMLDKMWQRHLKDPMANQFLNKVLDIEPHECKNKDKEGPYNEYDDAYIYRYVSYKDLDLKVENLLAVMADDIVATYKTLTQQPTL